MAQRKVQQFYVSEDDFYELGDPQTLNLTDGELRALVEYVGEPILLEERNGFFVLIEEG